MVTFTGPFNVKKLDAETTVASVDVSGTATFAAINNTGGQTIGAASIDASATATFKQVLNEDGHFGLFVSRSTVVAANTAAAPVELSFGTNVDIVDITFRVEEPFTTGAGATAANVAVSAAAGALIVSFNVSASGTYNIPAAGGGGGTSFRDVSATLEAHVSIQASNTAMANGQGILWITYIGR